MARRLLCETAMTRSFHHAVRLVPRRGPRARLAPRPYTLSFTSFRLIPITDHEPVEAEYEPIELCDPSNAMRALARKPRAFAR